MLLISGTEGRVQENNKDIHSFEFSWVAGHFFIMELLMWRNFHFSFISGIQVFTEILIDTHISNFHSPWCYFSMNMSISWLINLFLKHLNRPTMYIRYLDAWSSVWFNFLLMCVFLDFWGTSSTVKTNKTILHVMLLIWLYLKGSVLTEDNNNGLGNWELWMMKNYLVCARAKETWMHFSYS